MSLRFAYDDAFDPPAPVVPLRVAHPARRDHEVLLRALIDTGADATCIPAFVANRLRLPTVEHALVEGVGGAQTRARVHAAWVRVGTIQLLARVVALAEEAIVGRDVLARGVFVLDGPKAITILQSKRR